jgi:glycerol kinase
MSADASVLLGGIQKFERELGIEVERLRSTGIMARNLVVPLSIASALAAASAFRVSLPLVALGGALVLALAAVGSWRHGQERAVWAHSKTLELAFWIPELDEFLRAQPKPPAGPP